LHRQNIGYADLHIQQAIDAEIWTNCQNNVRTLGKRVATKTKRFANKPLDPVAPHSVTCFTGYTNAQSTVLEMVRQKNERKSIPSASKT
jgi:hypothetical protein